MPLYDPFHARDTFDTGSGTAGIYRLSRLEDAGLMTIARLPYSIRILLEAVLRGCDGYAVTERDVKRLAGWNAAAPTGIEVPFKPARVILQDFTGVPCVVDLAAMRSAMRRLGGDPKKINPLVPVDLVIDHSVQVDFFGGADSMERNVAIEFQRNRERYEFLRWGQTAFRNFRVVPPAVGIVHQVNLEYLAKAVFLGKDDAGPVAYPDTLVGTDSHTTMINGLGVLGWGVGGIEAEAVMLGQPLYMLAPEVIGFELSGELPPGATATDLVLTVTQILRKEGVVNKFVEYFGPAIRRMKVADRALVANMSPEYGATMGFFPIDEQTLAYLRLTGRSEAEVQLVERYTKEQQLYYSPADAAPTYTKVLKLDLCTIEPSLAGPKRPQDRVPLASVKREFRRSLQAPVKERGFGLGEQDASAQHGRVCRRWPQRHARPRRRGDRVHYKLHQHEQSGCHARRGSAGEEGRRSRADGQTLREDEPRPRQPRGDGLLLQVRIGRRIGQTRFQSRRLRLHNVHRQQRPAARSGGRGRDQRQSPQAPARQVVYIENTPMFVQIAEGLGIQSILHTDYRSTCAKLASFGLRNDEGGAA